MTVQPVDLNTLLGGAQGANAAGASGGSSPTSTMFDKDMFLSLLVAQMRYQNPLDPMKSTEFMQQAAQLASVEAVQSMAAAQTQATEMQTAFVAASLVGRQVTGTDASGAEVTGVVDRVMISPAGVALEVDGKQVPLASVSEIALPPAP